MPNLQHKKLRREKTPNLRQQNLREEKNTKFTTPKFTSEKHMPNLQHQYLHEEKKTPNLQHQNLHEQKKRQIYNIKIYVRKKNAKFTTSKFT